MKKTSLITLALLSISLTSQAYQVTGPVLEVTPTKIVVQKGKEKWELVKNTSTQTPDLKVGDKVTVFYNMTAEKIESKTETRKKK